MSLWARQFDAERGPAGSYGEAARAYATRVSITPAAGAFLQRHSSSSSSSCACGGGCPNCLEKKPGGFLQTKLTVGAPGDVDEQEADRVAEDVMSKQSITATTPTLQLKPADAPREVKPEFKGCEGWEAEITKYLSRGREWVNNAIEKLEDLIRKPKMPIKEVDEELNRKANKALNLHFHLDEVGEEKRHSMVLEILENFREISAGFASTPFRCETECSEPGVSGEVGMMFRWLSDIHLCPCWFYPEDPECHKEGVPLPYGYHTLTLIHEMAHKYAGRKDVLGKEKKDGKIITVKAYNYLHPDAYRGLNAQQAVRNADCYAFFAREFM